MYSNKYHPKLTGFKRNGFRRDLIEVVLAILSTFPTPLYCQDDDQYVDFTDMGSYDHGLQVNEINSEEHDHVTKVSLTTTKSEIALMGISADNGSRPMKFLQRAVKSLLRQMNVQSHTFGPGEVIAIDLQAEIKYNDYVILNKFVNAEEQEEPDKYLKKVDDVMSNLLHVAEHSSSRFDYVDYIYNLPIFNSLKFWLVLMTMSVVCFFIVMLSSRAYHARNNVSMFFYGFLIIFILSCIWTFSYMYEEAKATNCAKLVQAQSPPKECEYENLNFGDSVVYFFRANLFGYKDQCEQYYSTTMNDPFWSVNPLEAISTSFSRLVFAPFGYIGEKLGKFFGGIISGIPFWLQPLLVLLIFGFPFMSLFGYRVVSPFLTIEPARREYLTNHEREYSTLSGPAITDRIKNELVERPERKVMKSIRNAQTDMDGFQNYLDGVDDDDPTQDRRSSPSFQSSYFRLFQDILLQVWDFILRLLDAMLPTSDSPLEQHDNDDDDSFNFGNARVSTSPEQSPPHRNRQYSNDEAGPSRLNPIEIEDVLIPRRIMHVGLERSDDKENMKPSSSISCPNSTQAEVPTTKETFDPTNSDSSSDEENN